MTARIDPSPDRTKHLFLHQLQALEIAGESSGIPFCELTVEVIRHDRYELTPIRPDTGSHSLDDIGLTSPAQPGLGIGREVGRGENPKPGI
jgi:hypothetical protein